MSSLVFLSSSPLSQKPTKHNLEVFNGWPRLSPFLVDFLQIAINSGQVVVSHQLQECHGLASGRSGFPTLFLMKITMIYYCHLPWYWYDNIISYVHGPWIKTSLNRQRFRRFFFDLKSGIKLCIRHAGPMGSNGPYHFSSSRIDKSQDSAQCCCGHQVCKTARNVPMSTLKSENV